MQAAEIEKLAEENGLLSEKTLRKCENPRGTWYMLGNGEKWCIPAMPLGQKRHQILEFLKKIRILEEDLKKAKDDSDAALSLTGDLFEIAHSALVYVLQLNYPNVTEEFADEENLFSSNDLYKILAIVQGNALLEELMEAQQPDEKKMT
jgi:hypothetical protein